jgi:hypothetical protein
MGNDEVRLIVGPYIFRIPHQVVLDQALSNMPDLVVGDFNSLTPQEQTFRLGLKPICRMLLGMMTWAAGQFDKEEKYPRPLSPDQLVQCGLDILVYTAQYIIKLALIACSEKDWLLDVVTTSSAPTGLDTPSSAEQSAATDFLITGLHPAPAEVDRPQDVGQAERPGTLTGYAGQPELPSQQVTDGGHRDHARRSLGDSGSNGNGQDNVQQAADGRVSAPLPTEA